MIRFHKERMMLPVVPDEWAVELFTKGSKSAELRRIPKGKGKPARVSRNYMGGCP